MSNSTRNVLIVVLVFCGVVASVVPLRSADQGEKPKVQQWEFAAVADWSAVKRLGEEGYQLVTVAHATNGNVIRYHLQRPKH
jgi:hypothetical protein